MMRCDIVQAVLSERISRMAMHVNHFIRSRASLAGVRALVFGGAILGGATVVSAQTPSVQELARHVKQSRGQIRTLSHKFRRTYTPGDGKQVDGQFAMGANDDRRMDLGIVSGSAGEKTSIYNLGGDVSSFLFGGASKPKLQNATLHESTKSTATGAGLLGSCYEIFDEKLDDLILRGRIVDGRTEGDKIVVESTLNQKVAVELHLSKRYGYLCTEYIAHQPDRSITEKALDWRPVGSIMLPTKSKVVVQRAGEPDAGHVDDYTDIRANEPVETLLRLPKLVPGVNVKDEAKGEFYEVGADGKLNLIGKVNKSSGEGSPLRFLLAIGFMGCASLGIFSFARQGRRKPSADV